MKEHDHRAPEPNHRIVCGEYCCPDCIPHVVDDTSLVLGGRSHAFNSLKDGDDLDVVQDPISVGARSDHGA